MNITVTDQEHCKKELRIEIPGEKVREETNKIASNLAREVSVPGFRPGHVPPSVVKTRFRKELRDEVISHLLPHALGDAIKEKDLKVIGEPGVSDFKYGDDDSINVTFTVEVAPEFELTGYKNLALTKHVYKVRDEDVERAIERYREAQAELIPVEDRGAQNGDVVSVEISGEFVPVAAEAGSGGDQPAEAAGGEADAGAESEAAKAAPAGDDGKGDEEPEKIEKHTTEIELGKEGVLNEFNEALSGARPGEVRTFTVTYPTDYSSERYAGRSVNYSVEVTSIGVKQLPEANDDFARNFGDEYKSMEDLRAKLRKDMEEQAEQKSKSELESKAFETLLESNKFEVPEFAVEKQMDSRIQTFARQMMMQGLDPRQMRLDWDSMRESMRERAERDVRATFILDRIAERENLEASDEEVDKEVEELAERSQQPAAALKARLTKEGALDSIKEQVRTRKALDLVIASAEIKTEEVEGLNQAETEGQDEGERAQG